MCSMAMEGRKEGREGGREERREGGRKEGRKGGRLSDTPVRGRVEQDKEREDVEQLQNLRSTLSLT